MINLKKLFKKGNGGAVRVSFLPGGEDGPAAIAHRKKIVAVIFFGFALIGLLIWGGFVWRLKTLEGEIDAAKQTARQIETVLQKGKGAIAEAQSISAKITAAKALLLGHRFWTSFFQVLQDNTLPEVVYQSIAADDKGVNLVGTASSYEAVARQLIAFKNVPQIKDVKVSGLSVKLSPKGETQGVNFTLNLSVDPAIFKSL